MTHLGSIAAISNELDEMCVIHMNGRIFDPLIGRFMSADPFIQAPGNLQSYNRYAYVLNNPLAFTDPSGYFSLKNLFKVAVGVVIAVYAPQVFATYGFAGASAATATIVNSAAAGALAAGITTGSAKAALLGGFTGGLFGAAGLAGAGAGISEAAAARSTERYFAHALAGCISAVAGGGKCGQGAVSAVFGKFTTNTISGVGGRSIGGFIARGVATSVAGGVGSVIAGGKFANGAETAAYGYLFNACLHGQCGASPEESSAPVGETFDDRADITGQVGYGGTGHLLFFGGGFDTGVAFDTTGNLCPYVNFCGTFGLGIGYNTGVNFAAQTGSLQPGWGSTQSGFFWFGGAGPSGEAQLLFTGSTPSGSGALTAVQAGRGATFNGRAGGGVGGAGGVIGCRQYVLQCRPPSANK